MFWLFDWVFETIFSPTAALLGLGHNKSTRLENTLTNAIT